MKQKFLPLVVAALVSLFSPAGAAEPVSIDSLRTSGIVLQPVKGAKNVAVKTKGQRMAAFGIGMLVGNAMGSSAANPQEAMELAQQAGSLTQQAINDYGHQRVGLLGPAPVIQEALQAQLGTLGVPVHAAEVEGGYGLAVQQKVWSLEYEGMFKDGYRLVYAIDVAMKGPDGKKKIAKASCEGEFADKHPLPEWEADDYARVIEAAKVIGAQCATQVAGELGIGA